MEKARTGKRVYGCVDCRHCLKRVIREKGLACARWPEIEIERVDLECALHVRLNACFFFTSPQSLAIGLEALPAKLSGSETLKIRLVYIAPSEPAAEGFRTAIEGHWRRFCQDWQAAGQRDDLLERVSTTTTSRVYDDLLASARQDGFGMIILADGPNVPSGEVLASKWREGIFISQPCLGRANKIFCAVDLSPSTHVLLRFLAHAFLERPGGRFRFVHVLEGSARVARKRWGKMLPLSGWDADTPLELMPRGPDGTARTLLDAAAGWDAVIVGRRGMSRIKSLLLGSVSRRILRAVSDATVVIVS